MSEETRDAQADAGEMQRLEVAAAGGGEMAKRRCWPGRP